MEEKKRQSQPAITNETRLDNKKNFQSADADETKQKCTKAEKKETKQKAEKHWKSET